MARTTIVRQDTAAADSGIHRFATAITTLAMVAIIAAIVAGLRQAEGLPLLTEDPTWMLFATG